jgi:hypothetical protein
MGTIISFEDFTKKGKKDLSEDAILPTGDSTVFVAPEEGSEGHHNKEEKNYMFFKNLYTMKKCIDEIMEMDKDQVDELIEKGHDWASDHISSAKDDIQEVFDWIRYEIDNYEGEEGSEEMNTIEIEPEIEEPEDDNEESDDEESDDEESEEEGSEEEDDEEEEEDEAREGLKYSYEELKK